jgi:regulator of protease activity HflC (stomatin/prohibitin superfamily)
MIMFPYFLKEDEQLLVESLTKRYTLNGPGWFNVGLFESVSRRKALTLGRTEYVRVRDTLTGELRNELGPKMFFLKSHEEITEHLTALPLKAYQYVRVFNTETGLRRVVNGPTSLYLAPYEQIQGEIKDNYDIDGQTALLLRDLSTGQLSLITRPQVFTPTINQSVEKVLKRIQLEDHETVVIKDRDGKFQFKRGTDAERSFFLEPYAELVTFCWSTGIHKDQCTLKVTHLDTRPKFMWYEFEARTQDNVELNIGITFFSQVVDVEALVRMTSDMPRDVCAHARSVIIQAVSQVSLEKFLAEFNAIVREAVLAGDTSFYLERGIKIHAVEVRNVACKDPATQKILQEIIQETTNRLNRLQKQESENEVAVEKVRGEITAEEMKGKLIEVQREHARTRGLMEGEAEAIRVKAFLDGLGDVAAADKIAIFNTLRKQDALESLSTGNAQLYFTPNDVDLRIETRSN